MKHSAIKSLAIVMAIMMVFSLMTVSAGAVKADSLGKVRVIVKNETYAAADGAPWEGILLEDDYTLQSDDTMMSVVEHTLDSNSVTYSFNNYNYLATVNGLSEYACNNSGGWMMTLNDWFTSEGSDAYTVANGRLSDGDVITVLYTCSWGADVGSLWGDTNTQLKNISLDGASFTQGEDFSSSKTDYTITVDPGNDGTIGVIPEACNKNYQVRTYLNQYTPEQPGTEIKALSQKLKVKEGDVIFIGVGNSSWETMNQKADETVYKLTVSAGSASDDSLGKVRVIVKNETFAAADGAPWEGVLLEDDYTLQSDDTMMSVVEHTLDSNSVTYSFNNYNYLATVNGLSEYACNNSGGWMMTLNDWFTSEGSDAYTVANGRLSDGDVITVLYTCSWGADVGSLWGDTNTQLKNITLDGASFSWGEDFSSSKTDYTIIVSPDNDTNMIGLIPEAFNKNYRVKTYLNKYTPDQPGTEIKTLSQKFQVKEGDVIYIGVGNSNWETMNQKAEETVYKLTVNLTANYGDVDGNGKVNINDVTLLQKYLAKAAELNAYQLKNADCTKDGTLTIDDATAIQKMIAKFV